MTYLAVPIKVVDPDQAAPALAQAKDAGAEMIELRLDFLTHPITQAVRKVVTSARQTRLPIIATCRPSWEGGDFNGEESLRLKLLVEATRAGADYLDIELACFDNPSFKLNSLLGSSSCKVIISYHNFDSKPADLDDRLKRIDSLSPDVGKIVYQAHNINDNFTALDILYRANQAGRSIIALVMGEAGVITRLMVKKLGGFLTFASLSEGAESASGQTTVSTMRGTFLWDRISPETAVFGVVGCPVAHSMGSAVHNTAFSDTGFNGLYLPMLVAPEREVFFDFLDGLIERKWLNIKGLSVTIPHKYHALEYVRQRKGHLEPLAEKIGAVNTIVFDETGNICGYNTDYAGALDALTNSLNIKRQDLKGKIVAIIGAGGVARAIVAGLTEYGCNVTIYNRTVEKAQRLAEDFGCKYAPLNELKNLSAELLINATSVGMHPRIDESPIPAEVLRPGHAVFDIVYNPYDTKMLQEARKVGAHTIDGVSMFVNQAAAQFEFFTGLKAPIQVMRTVIERNLRSENKNTPF